MHKHETEYKKADPKAHIVWFHLHKSLKVEKSWSMLLELKT